MAKLPKKHGPARKVTKNDFLDHVYTKCKHCDHFVDENVGWTPDSLFSEYVHLEDGDDQEFDHEAVPGEHMTLAKWQETWPALFKEHADGKIGPNSRYHVGAGKVVRQLMLNAWQQGNSNATIAIVDTQNAIRADVHVDIHDNKVVLVITDNVLERDSDDPTSSQYLLELAPKQELTPSRFPDKLTREITAVIDTLPEGMRVHSHPGGGHEDVYGSLAISVSNLVAAYKKQAVPVEEVTAMYERMGAGFYADFYTDASLAEALIVSRNILAFMQGVGPTWKLAREPIEAWYRVLAGMARARAQDKTKFKFSEGT